MVAATAKGRLSNTLAGRKLHNPNLNIVPSLKIFCDSTRTNGHRPSVTNSEPEEEFKKLSLIDGKLSAAAKSQGALKNLEKDKKQLDNLGKPNVRRKALADISNVRGELPRQQVLDGPKLLCRSRNSLVGTQAAGCSLRKPFSVGTVAKKLPQIKISNQTVKIMGSKETKMTLDPRKVRNPKGQFVSTTSSRTHDGHRPPLTRQSYPIVRHVTKESTERSPRCKERCELPVSSYGGRTVASQVNCHQSRFGKSRVSDGCIAAASNGQLNMNVGASRRSVKLLRTMRTTKSKTERTTNSKIVSGLTKPPATKSTSSKKNDEKAKLSSANNIGKVEDSSSSKSESETTAAANVATRKSGRRKSFTSLLTSRSSVNEDLPNIYDARNQLEVSEYIDDIYQYYWVMEAQNRPLKQYMDIQSEITPHMRGILINWLIEVHLKFDLMQETLFLMVTLLDQFLSCESIKKNKMQLVGLTALLLASKYEDFWHPMIMDLVGVSADAYTRDEMLRMENVFLTKLKFRLNAPTPYVFMLRFIKAAQSNKKFEHLAFYLIELCLVEYEALKYKPSLLSASAIYLARCTMHMTPTWTPLLQKHSRYEEVQIRECAEMILKFQKSAKTSLLKVTYEKFMRPEFSKVAAVTPLAVLP